jgi:seryl-tRNA synthetase
VSNEEAGQEEVPLSAAMMQEDIAAIGTLMDMRDLAAKAIGRVRELEELIARRLTGLEQTEVERKLEEAKALAEQAQEFGRDGQRRAEEAEARCDKLGKELCEVRESKSDLAMRLREALAENNALRWCIDTMVRRGAGETTITPIERQGERP